MLQNDQGGGGNAAGAGVGIGGMLFGLIIALGYIIGMWKVFAKAGEPGWAAIIPIYNTIVLLKIAGRPLWWLLLFFVPFVNVIIIILVSIDVARKFGKGAGFGIGLALLGFIFYPVLGFGDARYNAAA
jgi:hypothetical protein